MNALAHRREADLKRVLLLLAPAIAIVVGTEFIVVGLLQRIAIDLGISLATAGQLTALFALAAAIAGPFVTLFAGRFATRNVLVAILAIYAVGNAVMALTSSFPLMLLARIVQGAALPAFISVGTAEVGRLAVAGKGKALARANLGFVLGVLIALPAGIALAEGANWRLPFIVLTAAPLIVAATLATLLPDTGPHVPPSTAHQLGLLRNGTFITHLALSIALMAAMFSAYTYLGVLLESAIGLDADGVALALLAFGIIGLGGNAIAGRVADRAPLLATAVMVTTLAISVIAASRSHDLLKAAVPLAIWGLTHTAGITLSQIRVTLAGAGAPAFAMTLNVSAANLGIALGASAGGWAVDQWGLPMLGVAPGMLALLVLLIAYGLANADGLRLRLRLRFRRARAEA